MEDSDGDGLDDINDPSPCTKLNNGKIITALSKSRIDALSKAYETTNNSNNLSFDDENLQETREKIIILQKCLEYLNYLDMYNYENDFMNPYGTFGGLSISSTMLYQVNHRMYVEDSISNYGIDEITYYSIILSAYNAGFELDQQTVQNANSRFKNKYIPKSIPMQGTNFYNSIKSERSSSKETIYTYDFTKALNEVLRYGALEFHFHNYQCNYIPSYVDANAFDIQTYNNSNYVCITSSKNYIWLIQKVKDNAKYDIKARNSWNELFKTVNANVPYYHNAFPFVFDGEEINAEIFGNILYGFICNAGGFDANILSVGGSGYSYIKTGKFDNNEDSESIKLGYNLYNEVKKDYDYLHIKEVSE